MAGFGGYWDQFEPVAQGGMAAQPAAPVPAAPSLNTQLGGGTAAAAPISEAGAGTTMTNPATNQVPAGAPPAQSTDYQTTFNQLFPGESLSPQELASKESQLPPGWRLLGPNAKGERTKIELPNGQIIDAIGGAGSGANRKQFMVTGGGGGGAGGGMGNYEVGMFTGGGQYPLSSVMGTGLAAPWTTPFNAPTDVTEQNDPGFQFRLKEGANAMEHSAAAKGTLLTGGFQKALNRFAQDQASNEYSGVYSRALGQYNLAHDIFRQNQGDLYSRLYNVAGLGQNAAANVGNAAGAYGTNAGNVMLGQGNAAAGGTAASGAAYSNAVGNIGNIAATSYQQAHQPQFQPYSGGNYPAYGNPDYVQGEGVPS